MSGGPFHPGGIIAACFAAIAVLLYGAPASSGLPAADSTSLGGPSGVVSSIVDDGSALDFYKRLYDFGLGKRAYGYGPEYKRIPGYNFGLGKRAEDRDRMYSFGLGKRDRSFGKTYSFGIGKRVSDYSGEDDEGLVDRDEGEEEGEEGVWGEEEWAPEETKRARQMYSFGLGKRARQYSFGIGKRARTYSFGIGKRYPRYGFGIGKREEEEDDEAAEEEKRRDHRFSFGLGKREVGAAAAEDEKRGRYYDFGLGKRSEEEEKRSPEVGAKGRTYAQPGFGRAGRRTYSFGLGKRLPMYDFGLGKRAERAATSATTAASVPESGNDGKN